MKRFDLLVVGAGPAGLSAAVRAARAGLSVAIFDENARPGGQLFKQIHKFFGSREHHAKIRGIRIGAELLEEAREAGVEVHLGSVAVGIYEGLTLNVSEGGRLAHYRGNAILVAAGAMENTLTFPGWTLPGVMGAGAAQTLMNLYGVRPGKRVLMVGSGNVGLVVSYQLLQAGVEVAAVVDAAPRIGGYGVHAAKIARCGVPFCISHTIVRAEADPAAEGNSLRVSRAVIARVDEHMKPVPGTETSLDVDTICLAVGLLPMSQLLSAAGCEMREHKGCVPVLDEHYETSIPGIFAAGDAAGIEEASSAMITGRLAAVSIARKLGFLPEEEFRTEHERLRAELDKLHQGMFGPAMRGRTDLAETDEGIPLSRTLLEKGYLTAEEAARFPGGREMHPADAGAVRPVIECTQNIPCNPCEEACRFGCIRVGEKITALPRLISEKTCVGCGACVAACPGQSIFLVKEEGESAQVTIPWEFLPLPPKGERGHALSRSGEILCEAEVTGIRTAPDMDHTYLLTMRVPAEMKNLARQYRGGER